MNGGTVLQDWSTSASLTTSTLLGGNYSVTVEVSTANSGWTAQFTSTAVPYVITYPPATGVSLTPSTPSPIAVGTTVTWTAVGSSSISLPASAYQYRFFVSANSGSTWTMVQDYGVGSTYSWTPATIGSGYMVNVHCRTNPAVTYQVNTVVNYNVIATLATPATGVTITANPSVGTVGVPVTFSALGTGSTTNGTPTPQSVYDFQFFLSTDGAITWTLAQSYGNGASFTWTPPSPNTGYAVNVWVRTQPTVALDKNNLLSYPVP
jgi:hypothetical protein